MTVRIWGIFLAAAAESVAAFLSSLVLSVTSHGESCSRLPSFPPFRRLLMEFLWLADLLMLLLLWLLLLLCCWLFLRADSAAGFLTPAPADDSDRVTGLLDANDVSCKGNFMFSYKE